MGARIIALTHVPSPAMNDCVRTFAEYAPIDLARVRAQHEAYRGALAECGADVALLDVNAAHPDCVFIEDTAIVLDEIAVMTPMGTPSRSAEPAGIESALRRHRPIARIAAPGAIEGGDVVVVGKTILVGATDRTNALGREELARIVRPHGYEVHTVRVRGCLHLKTACTALPDGSLLVNPAWIDRDALRGFEIVEVARDEPHAANVVAVGDHAIFGAGSPNTAALLRARGVSLRIVDLSELAKADGCGTCLSLLFRAP